MKKRKEKRPEDYNTHDLRRFWCEQYSLVREGEYQTHGYGGHELHALKQLLDSHDIFMLLLAIVDGLRKGEESIVFFSQRINEYLPKCENPMIEYYVAMFGREETVTRHKRLKYLESQWLPTAVIQQEKKVIEEELMEWVNGIT